MNRDSRISADSGAVAVLTAIMAVMLFAIAALVVDLGVARDSRRQAQNTADAAALAAANALYATQVPNPNRPGDFEAAIDAAKSYAFENYGTTEEEWASCNTDQALGHLDLAYAGTNCISFNDFLYPREVLVVVPVRQQPSIFGGVVGYQGVGIGALAQARLDPGGYRPCVFCVLGSESTHDLQNGKIYVDGGNMWFNGNVNINPGGIAASSEGLVTGEDGEQFLDGGNAFVEGTVSGSGKFQDDGNAQLGQPRIVDPLAAKELPFELQQSLSTSGDDACEDGPGIYEGLDGRRGTCFLQPGLYVFTGEVDFSGNGNLVAAGVTMYFTCGTPTAVRECNPEGGEPGGGIDLSGNGANIVEAPLASTYGGHPDVEEDMYGYAIVYDRNNTATMRLVGNGASEVSGAVYGVNATLDFRGNGGADTVLSSWVIVGDITFSGGNATLNVQFDSTKNPRASEGDRGLVR